MPPSITLEMAKGFSLFMLKAVLSGTAATNSSTLAKDEIFGADHERLLTPNQDDAVITTEKRSMSTQDNRYS